MSLVVREIGYDDARFAPLVEEGLAGDGSFLVRLKDEWLSGANRFEGPGERLLGAFAGGTLVGVGGISRDPYHPAEGLGRVRHVYVLKAHRRRGVGRALMERILERASSHYAVLRLRTRSPDAVQLYERFGFVRTDAPGETHRLVL